MSYYQAPYQYEGPYYYSPNKSYNICPTPPNLVCPAPPVILLFLYLTTHLSDYIKFTHKYHK